MMKIWKNSNFSIFSILCENFFEFSTSVKSKSFRCLFNQILFFTFCTYNAAAYAFGVRHVAPSPPGARDEPRGGDAPRHRHWILRCFFFKLFCKVSRTRACRYTLYLLFVLISTLKAHYRTRKCIFVKISILSFFFDSGSERSFNLESFRSLFNQILFFTFRTHNAAAYAEGVRHVAPSPPGVRDDPRGGDAPHHRHWIPRCFFF